MIRIMYSVSAAVFVYFLMILIIGKVGTKEERLIRKRISNIQRLRQYHKIEAGEEKEKNRLDLSWVKLPAGIEKDLKTSGIKADPKEFAVIWLMVTIFPPILLLMAGGSILVAVGVTVAGAVFPPLFVKQSKKSRMEKFQNQLAEALLIFGNTIRAGLTFERALAKVAEGLPSPISEELKQTSHEMEVGSSIEAAMEALADRMQNEDLRLVTSAVVIQIRVGGNLADILDNISGTIKDRITIKRNIKTLTAQGRMSALVIGGLPFVLFGVVSMITPGYMDPMFETSVGHTLLIVAGVMEIIGFMIMAKMTDIKY